MKPRKRLITELESAGFSVSVQESAFGTIYYEAFCETDSPDEIGDCLIKIREADHVARPTYQMMNGSADFEIGTHQDADGDWKEAAAYCLRVRDSHLAKMGVSLEGLMRYNEWLET